MAVAVAVAVGASGCRYPAKPGFEDDLMLASSLYLTVSSSNRSIRPELDTVK